MPSALPSSRAVSLTAEATPCLAAGSDSRDRRRRGRACQAHAGREQHQPGGEDRRSKSTLSRETTTNPEAMSSRPSGASRRKPTRAASCGALRASGIITQGSGSSADAASQRGVADDELQVLQHDEEEAEGREELHRDGQGARR